MNRTKHKKVFQYGNFDHYYGYRTASYKSYGENTDIWNDPRITVLKKRYFKNKSVLDIGCNVGYLTISLAEQFKPKMILGVDIDGALIVKARNILNMRANEHKREVEKKTRSKSGSNDSDVSSSSHCTDSLLSFRNYHFKECSIYSDGFSSQPISDTLFRTFPYTVYFKQENFLENTHFGGPYDTITCFSVTKWVHLNWGDDGLLLLLVKSCVLLKQGGLLIIEYQPWASYEKRQNYTELFARNYPCLRLRPEKIPVILQQLGMQLIREQKPPQQKGPPGFNRNITVFKKTSFELKLDVQTLTLSSLRQVLDVESLIERVETDELLVS